MLSLSSSLQPVFLFFRCLLFVVAVCLPATGFSHEVRPSIVDLELGQSSDSPVTIRLNLEAVLAGIGAEHEDTDDSEQAGVYNELRALAPEQLEQRFTAFSGEFLESVRLKVDGRDQPLTLGTVTIPEVGDVQLARDSHIQLKANLPATGELVWEWPQRFGASVLRINQQQSGAGESAELYTAYLQAGQASDAIALSNPQLQRGGWDVFKDYVVIGYEHILPKGLDHILFVVGLFLLSASLSALLWQVTSFTLAHSVTLALGMLGWIQVSPAIVEPLIAASIVYICLENVFSDHLSRWRPVVIFIFGLLHGLGFASVLTDIGLESDSFALGLVAFNIGVELGQLSVIALCFLAVGWFLRKDWYRKVISIPASLVIAAIGAYWFLERTVL